ncbi:MAG: hypothetical protein Q4G07_03220 [Oscillospiraceae bacterium]|nr:hypothetical protein [Oscillospiraceae bacterium]
MKKALASSVGRSEIPISQAARSAKIFAGKHKARLRAVGQMMQVKEFSVRFETLAGNGPL